MAIYPSPEAQTGALASVQPRLCGFDQGRPSLGSVVNARCFGKAAVLIHDDAAAASPATRGSSTIVGDPNKNVVLRERSVVNLRKRRRVRHAGSQSRRIV